MPFRIMVVEDEKSIRQIIIAFLKEAGYMVKGYTNGIDALSDFSEFKPHMMILDISMKGISGIDVLKEVREFSDIPAIILTALTSEADRLKGFDFGADDYVCKPFSPRELVSRVNVFIKRLYKEDDGVIIYDDLRLDTHKRTLSRGNEVISVTSREYDILYLFFNNIGIPLTREQIIRKALGYEFDGYDRSIDSYIKNIRHKIEKDWKKPAYIKTKYGFGYIFGGEANEH